MSSFAAVILCAGKSARFGGGEKKTFVELGGRAVWLHSFGLFTTRSRFKQIVVVVSPDDLEMFRRRFLGNLALAADALLVDGGAERFDSVRNALAKIDSSIEFVAVHDAARALVTGESIDAVCDRAEQTGAAILATPIVDTLKRIDGEKSIVETVDRRELWAAQTPQVFRRTILIEAYARLKPGESVTDDAQLVERIGLRPSIVEGDPSNVKITSRRDLAVAEAILKSRRAEKPKGFHPFAEDELWK